MILRLAVSAVALAAWIATPREAWAQDSGERTTLGRAIELIDAHLASAQREADPELRRRVQIEGDLALLALPARHRQYEAADRLRVIDEGLPRDGQGDRDMILQGLRVAGELAEEAADLERIVQIDRQYHGSVSTDRIENFHFGQLIEANDPDAMAWFVRSQEAGTLGALRRVDRIKSMCRRGYRELARHAAIGLGDPALDESIGPLLADLGAAAEAECRADRSMTATARLPAAGPGILAALAVAASRRSDPGEVARIVRKLNDALDSPLFAPAGRPVPTDYGDCSWSLAFNYARQWWARSVDWQSAYKLTREPSGAPDERPVILGLAGAVAGAGSDAGSVELIDRLIDVYEKDRQDAGLDLASMMVLANEPADPATAQSRAVAVYWLATKQSLLLARFAAGGEIDEAAAQAISLDWVMQFLGSFPRSDLPRRLLSLLEAELQRIAEVHPRLLPQLQFMALVLEGKPAAARVLLDANPRASNLEDWRLLYLIRAQENAGLRERAVAAFDAYLEIFFERDLSALRLLLVQGQVDKARIMLREFVASDAGAFGISDVFLGTMLLRELGDRTDIATLVAMRPDIGAMEMGRRLVAVVDAFAWDAASDEIGAAIRQLPAKLTAELPEREAGCLRDTLIGLQAVALARHGDLEGGIRLVSGRSLERRRFCSVRDGYGGNEPIFDVRFLVQEWVRRGHAVP